MPHQKRFDVEKLKEVLLKNKFLLYDATRNKYYGPNQGCWDEISKLTEGSVKSKHIYTIVKENRYGIASKLNVSPTHDVKSEGEEDVDELGESDNFDMNVSDVPVSSRDEISSSIKFTLTLPKSEWEGLFCTAEYKDKSRISRNYNILKPFHWTNIISDYFFRVTHLRCCLSFDSHNVMPFGAEAFLKFSGHCSGCESNFKSVAYEEPNNDSPLTINCEYIVHFNICTTNKKRRLIGKRREMFSDKLIKANKSSTYIRREEACKIMQFSDPEPSRIPTGNTLRILKLRILKHRANLDNTLDPDPFLALLKMKLSSPYNCILHDIGLDPFFLHYWSSHELNAYRLYVKKTRNPTISIDATGGLVKPLIDPDDKKSSHIFLYKITVHDAELRHQFSTAHMLSARHNNNAIAYWLAEWYRTDVLPPQTVVIDDSLALIMACVRVFTQYSTLTSYLEACAKLLMQVSSPDVGVQIPTCYVRLDFNHVIHSMASWVELRNKSRRVKNFYLRALGVIISSTDYEDTKMLLRQIFYVFLHEEDGNNNEGKATACERARLYLKDHIADHNIRPIEEYDVDLLDSDELDKVNENNDPSNTPEVSFFAEINDIF